MIGLSSPSQRATTTAAMQLPMTFMTLRPNVHEGVDAEQNQNGAARMCSCATEAMRTRNVA
jgi:hypothetical protein